MITFDTSDRYNTYIDEILIDTSSMNEHERIVVEDLRPLEHNDLAADIAKCEFHKKTIEFFR